MIEQSNRKTKYKYSAYCTPCELNFLDGYKEENIKKTTLQELKKLMKRQENLAKKRDDKGKSIFCPKFVQSARWCS